MTDSDIQKQIKLGDPRKALIKPAEFNLPIKTKCRHSVNTHSSALGAHGDAGTEGPLAPAEPVFICTPFLPCSLSHKHTAVLEKTSLESIECVSVSSSDK